MRSLLRPGALLVATALVLASCASHATPGPDGRGPVEAAAPASAHPSPAVARSSSRARPAPRAVPRPCARNRADQLVLVDLGDQRMWLCHRDRTVLGTPVTSGRRGQATPTGTYVIQGRNRNSMLTLADGRTYDVAYWIPFDAPDFGFHDSPWQRFPYGSGAYRTRGSHGCVHVPARAIGFLYRWVEMGAKVVIRR